MLCGLQATAFAQYTLPNYGKTVGYVSTLIDSYNALVNNSTYATRPDFDKIKSNFLLYHDPGYSFKVIVVQSVPETADYVALIFIPIQADQPNIIADSQHTMYSLFGGAFYMTGEYGLLENDVIQSGNIQVQIHLAWVILSTDISGDYVTNANNAAHYIYQQDTKQMPVFPLTVTTAAVYSPTVTQQLPTTVTGPLLVTAYVSTTQSSPTQPNSTTVILIIVAVLIVLWAITRKRRKKPKAAQPRIIHKRGVDSKKRRGP